MVNLQWVREHYYVQLAEEISRIGDPAGTIPLAIADDAGVSVASLRSMDTAGAVRQREFSPLFFDPAMLAKLAPDRPTPRPWTVRVASVEDEVQMAATRGAYAMLIVAAFVSLFGLLFTTRAVRAREQLIAMQTEFVSTVTHELKTPLAVIRLLGETLGTGRYDSLETVRDYAQLLSQEACRLTRLIENLLTYSRLTEQHRSDPLEVIEVGELVEDTLAHFRPRLLQLEFDVTVDVPVDLPRIRGDRSSLMQALDNLIDNAIKYSDQRRSLSIRSAVAGDCVRIEIADRGVGIPAADVPRVFDKFYRGRAVRTGGSGLGLAIVKRVVQEHNGCIEISSVVGEGTTLSLVLPLDSANG